MRERPKRKGVSVGMSCSAVPRASGAPPRGPLMNRCERCSQKGVEEAMQKGVPVYFVAQATVYRPRWYWRDERVARASRTWRLSYQPLTGSWRVSLGAIAQSAATAAEALAIVSRASRWKIADASEVDPGEPYYVEFSFRLDHTQLPRPMQLDLSTQAEWRLSVERTLRLE